MELVEFMSNKECVVENIQSKWSYCKRQYGNRERFNGYTVLFRYDRAKEARIRKLSNGLYVM